MEIRKRNRCRWCNEKNPLYVRYHDEEWGIPQYADDKLFEMLLLEPFQAGLSWETVLKKREFFRRAFDEFDPQRISQYGEAKIEALLADPGIIRNRKKIQAAIQNAGVFLKIQQEFGSFRRYIWQFTDNKVIFETDKTSSPLSDRVSEDLKARGMVFVGTTIIYSYLQAIGVIQSHGEECFLHNCCLYNCVPR